jgi:hypothetical protein
MMLFFDHFVALIEHPRRSGPCPRSTAAIIADAVRSHEVYGCAGSAVHQGNNSWHPRVSDSSKIRLTAIGGSLH